MLLIWPVLSIVTLAVVWSFTLCDSFIELHSLGQPLGSLWEEFVLDREKMLAEKKDRERSGQPVIKQRCCHGSVELVVF